MRKNSAKVWLRGCKPRTYKKHYSSRIDVDGSFITLKQYTQHIIEWKNKKVGDPIFNVFRNRWEVLSKIKYRWRPIRDSWKGIRGIPNARYLEITGTTNMGFEVYEYDAEKYQSIEAEREEVRTENPEK